MAESGKEHGWQDQKSLPRCLMYMFENQIRTDVTFKIRSPSADCKPADMAAHQFLLSARSRIFEEMFIGGSRKDSQEVIINDVKPESVKEMLRYCLTILLTVK